MLPLTMARLIGAAWDADHISAVLVQNLVKGSTTGGAYPGGELGRCTLRVSLDIDRQKLSRDLQLLALAVHKLLNTSIEPFPTLPSPLIPTPAPPPPNPPPN